MKIYILMKEVLAYTNDAKDTYRIEAICTNVESVLKNIKKAEEEFVIVLDSSQVNEIVAIDILSSRLGHNTISAKDFVEHYQSLEQD
jgi:hypothetical protein